MSCSVRQVSALQPMLLRAEDDYLDGLARSRLPDEGTRVPCGALRDAPEVLRTRMVRLLLERLGAG